MSTSRNQQIQQLEQDWKTNPRWEGITRPYSANDVVNLRGSVNPECTLAQKVRRNCGSCCMAVRAKATSIALGH